jgi:hypothetical protein
MNNVVFLLSSERSGSNLIGRMFGARPDFCAPGPAHLFRVLGTHLERYPQTEIGASAFMSDLRELYIAKISQWALDDVDPKLEALDTQPSMAAAILAVYAAEAQAEGKSSLFIKENQAFKLLDLYRSVVKNPKFLFLTRDPRDMALSWHRSNVHRGGVVRASRIWAEDQTRSLELVSKLRTEFSVAQISYEDLVGTPDATLKAACKALGAPFAPEMLNFQISAAARRLAPASAGLNNLSRQLLRENTGKFHDGFNTEQIAFIEQTCAAPMAALGYEPVTDPSHPYGRFASLEDLTAFLEAEDPWEKPAYSDVPEEEQRLRKRWSDVRARILSRSFE